MVADLTRYFGLVLGVTLLISFASIAAPLRKWLTRLSLFFGSLLYCWICTGFWVGIGLALAGYYPLGAHSHFGEPPWLRATIESGFISMAFMFIASYALAGGHNPAFDYEQGNENDEKEKAPNGRRSDSSSG